METSNQYSGETSLAEFFNQYKDATAKWHTGYKRTCETIQNDPDITDETLALIWYQRDNSVSSLRQGAPSKEEFEKAKSSLRELTLRIKAEPSAEMYLEAERLMLEYKSKQLLNKNYKALLNRAFAAIAPRICISTLDYYCLIKALTYLNKRFGLGMSLKGNWFELNQAYTASLKTHLPEDYDHFLANMATWQVYEDLKENRLGGGIQDSANQIYTVEGSMNTTKTNKPLNQILYGPPGTGKTYQLQQLQAQYTNDNDVAANEQWLGAKIENLSWFEVIALILLDLGEATKVAQIIRHKLFQKKALINGRSIESLNATAWSSLQKFTIPESETVNYRNRSEPAIFNKTPDSKWLIVEDKKALISDLIDLSAEIKTGPSKIEPVKRYVSTTFHQSYGYEEFIEGLRASSTEDGAISYSVDAGTFLKLCRRAEQDPTNQYAIFIDEINRGNISKIFGELITLIEADKRAGCDNEMSVNLAYSGKSFSVPANVDIIGTMNTADRSLAMMDTALRRRFDFIEMMPEPKLLQCAVVKGIDLEQLLSVINQRIEILYDRDHTLGHAFFMPVKAFVEAGEQDKAFSALVSVFKNKIIPLLEEYFFEDWSKIRLVLADNQKTNNEPQQFVLEQKQKADDLKSLFGKGHNLDQYGQSVVKYTLASSSAPVWVDAEAYVGIYKPREEASTKSPESQLETDAELS